MRDAVVIHNLGKRFRRYTADRPKRLKDVFVRGVSQLKPVDHFWALRNVNFNVAPGRTVGIVGHNGSGKSTLLNIVGDVLQPDEGHVNVHGRVGALLALGAGFHPDLTGRENVFVNGTITGFTRQMVKEQFDSIVDFAELEDFIDSPIRTYSTGMRMRLAFAIAIHMQPEILLIDEVLTVGDTAFQDKCIERINQFREDGHTILIVSHSSRHIQTLCDEVIWLRQGQLVDYGDPEDISKRYREDMQKNRTRTPQTGTSNGVFSASRDTKPRMNKNHSDTLELKITEVHLRDEYGDYISEINSGDPLHIEIHYLASQSVKHPIFRVAISREDDMLCYVTNTETAELSLPTLQGQGKIKLQLDRLDLAGGSYFVNVGAHAQDWAHIYDHHHRVYPLIVRPTPSSNKSILHLPCHWDLSDIEVSKNGISD